MMKILLRKKNNLLLSNQTNKNIEDDFKNNENG